MIVVISRLHQLRERGSRFLANKRHKLVLSLEKRPLQAVGFYSIIGIAIATGLLLNFLHIDAVKALFWAAILNGLVAAPLMAVIMLMASNRKVMGKFVIAPYLKWVGWCATSIMLCVCIGVLISWKA